jgi:serine/threonine-protein kinase
MSDNPYQASTTSTDMPEVSIDVPEEVEKRITRAWVAGAISGSLTLVLTLLAVSGTAQLGGLNAWSFLDVTLIFGLTFGIYKKSRTCAVLMFIYYVGSKILQFVEYGSAGTGMGFGIIFAIFFGMGVAGTFQYHAIKKEAMNR